MGKLVVVNFVSLDGVLQSVLSADEDREDGFAHGGWVPPYMDPVVERFMGETTSNAAGLLLGRKTYEIFAALWPYADQNEPAVAAMNRMPKYVASRTLERADWNNTTIIGPDLASELANLLRQSAADAEILVFGSTNLLPTLIQHDLIDEYRLLVFPLFLGAGKRLTSGVEAPTGLELVSVRSSTKGVLLTTYRRGRYLGDPTQPPEPA